MIHMPYRILFVQSSLPHNYMGSDSSVAMEPDFACEMVDWRDVHKDRSAFTRPQLMVAVTYTNPEEAISLFRWLRSNPIRIPVLAIVSADLEYSDLRIILEGADEFVMTPVRRGELCLRIKRMLSMDAEIESTRSHLIDEIGMGQFVGQDPAFVASIEKIPSIGRVDASVLITGETGTGKELCARAIHHLSRRRGFPFIPIDCGTLPEQLFENEMFGHRRGAFTDAKEEQRGLVAMANGGTLFLDEIDALSPSSQAKILRLLQEHAYRPLGSDKFLISDLRIIAATNRDIELCVREKQFRADLYYRLNVLRVELPPVRKRPGDVALLSRHFLRTLCCELNIEQKTLSPAALQKLMSYSWPGNVREMRNVLHRALVFAEGSQVLPCHVSIPQSPDPVALQHIQGFRQAKAMAVAAFERMYIESALEKHHGNITKAAMEVGKERRAFGRLVKKYNISFRRRAG
jgi:DNA-binding NtrC family response regulator